MSLKNVLTAAERTFFLAFVNYSDECLSLACQAPGNLCRFMRLIIYILAGEAILCSNFFCYLLFLHLVLLIKIKLLWLQTSNKFWILYFNLQINKKLNFAQNVCYDLALTWRIDNTLSKSLSNGCYWFMEPFDRQLKGLFLDFCIIFLCHQ